MTGNPAHWRADASGLHLGPSLAASFQRYFVAEAPPLPEIPPSLGALAPSPLRGGHFLLPLYEGEAIWIALEFGRAAPRAMIAASSPEQKRVWSFDARGAGTIEMIAGAPESDREGCRFSLSSGDFRNIDIVAGSDSLRASVSLVGASEFQRLSGRAAPPPASRDNSYRGWRLP